MMLPKPERPLKARRAGLQRSSVLRQTSRLQPKRKTAAERSAREQCRQAVRRRDRGMCRCCHRAPIEQVHEEPPRSLGGDPLNPDDCFGVCAECHRKITGDVGVRIRVKRLAATCAGPLEFRNVGGKGREAWIG